MSEQQNQNTSEPVTGTVREREAWMTPAQQQKMQEIRATNAMVGAITQTSWGTKLHPDHRRALAEFIRRFKLDISEVNVLGGMPYRNGYYYRRRLAEMAAAGKVQWMDGYHIGPDEQLDLLAKQGDAWAIEKQRERLQQRIEFAVPPDASHAFVAVVKLHSLERPLKGCKFIIPGRTKMGWRDGKKEEVEADPVGEANPVESVESRAWRRVGLLAAAEIPELGQSEAAMETAAQQIAAGASEVAQREREQRVEIGGTMVAGQGTDVYAVDEEPKQLNAPVPETFVATETLEPEQLQLGDAPKGRKRDALREG